VACLLIFFSMSMTVIAQKRDFLNPKEIERLQEAQRIDLRISMLVTAADRRFATLESRSPIKKSEAEWGPAPQGTREELLRDIDRILMKAIDDIDYAATIETESKFFRSALTRLKTSCIEYKPFLKKLLDSSESNRESGTALSAMEKCEQIEESPSP